MVLSLVKLKTTNIYRVPTTLDTRPTQIRHGPSFMKPSRKVHTSQEVFTKCLH